MLENFRANVLKLNIQVQFFFAIIRYELSNDISNSLNSHLLYFIISFRLSLHYKRNPNFLLNEIGHVCVFVMKNRSSLPDTNA